MKMQTTQTRIDLDTRERLDTIVECRFGVSEPSLRETLHILVREEVDRLNATDPTVDNNS